MKYTYIEVREWDTNTPIHRIDVSGKHERAIDRVDDGLNINLNDAKYYTETIHSDNELPVGNLSIVV